MHIFYVLILINKEIGRNGEVKVWECHNGQNIKNKTIIILAHLSMLYYWWITNFHAQDLPTQCSGTTFLLLWCVLRVVVASDPSGTVRNFWKTPSGDADLFGNEIYILHVINRRLIPNCSAKSDFSMYFSPFQKNIHMQNEDGDKFQLKYNMYEQILMKRPLVHRFRWFILKHAGILILFWKVAKL